MELRHLRYFAAVAETRHFGRAAERLHMAQPALSQAIRQLEAELGAPLFSRTTRQVSLTPAGEFLHERGRADAGRRRGQRPRRPPDRRRPQGLVRIGFTGTAAFTHLPRIARIVKRELPGLALEIHADLLTPAQVRGLPEGSLDLGVLRPPTSGDGHRPAHHRARAAGPGRRGRPPPGHRAGRGHGRPAHRGLRRSTPTPDSAVNEAVVRSCREAGFARTREHEAPGTAVLLALVAAGLGVALVPASVRAVPLAGVVFRDVADAATIELALAWRTEDSSPSSARC